MTNAQGLARRAAWSVRNLAQSFSDDDVANCAQQTQLAGKCWPRSLWQHRVFCLNLVDQDWHSFLDAPGDGIQLAFSNAPGHRKLRCSCQHGLTGQLRRSRILRLMGDLRAAGVVEPASRSAGRLYFAFGNADGVRDAPYRGILCRPAFRGYFLSNWGLMQ
jgi:hypothetical protein